MCRWLLVLLFLVSAGVGALSALLLALAVRHEGRARRAPAGGII
jgi:hypothetical protein